nr:DUF881 domain-containing protein [Streptomyces sp. DSM 40971]
MPPEEPARKREPGRGPAEGAENNRPGGRPDGPENSDGAGGNGARPPRDREAGNADSREPKASSGDSAAAANGAAESSEEKPANGPAGGGERRPPAESAAAEEESGRTGRQRLAQAVWPPRVTRAQLIVALLLFVLGLGLAIQVRSTSENSSLRGARQEDLVRILDELDDRTKRLEDEKQSLEGQRTELENSSDQAEEARKQTRQKARQLGVLAGTVGAQGTGIELTITDPGKSVEADMLLDAVQELRAAGAEAIEVNNVRVVANTYFSDSAGGVSVDGHKISPPYRFQVIGKPKDLEPALNIPGGVVQTLRKEQADASVQPSEKIVVDALRSAKRPDYARSSQR